MDILVVDDDDIAAEMLAKALEAAGHSVRMAANGVEALDVLAAEPIRMVISDWVMPEMNGLELCRQIRGGSFPAYIYIILLTSQDRPEDVVEGLSAGADDFITKPFSPAELIVRLNVGARILSLETRHVAIFALAKLAESRDPETGYHLERMRNYSRILAAHVAAQPDFRDALSPEYVETIYLTSPLHDIGKVGIPDFVLLKPGRLTDGEFAVMKRHTEIGAGTLAAAVEQHPNVEYLRMARNIALCHHERFNGSGYPLGLAGSRIPLCARIVALADVYDALISKRVYKAAMPHDVARSILIAERGQHLDPLVVDAFLANEHAFLACHDEFAEQPVAV